MNNLKKLAPVPIGFALFAILFIRQRNKFERFMLLYYAIMGNNLGNNLEIVQQLEPSFRLPRWLRWLENRNIMYFINNVEERIGNNLRTLVSVSIVLSLVEILLLIDQRKFIYERLTLIYYAFVGNENQIAKNYVKKISWLDRLLL
ncbi:hypothetical protein C1645_872920 [Glomus cerebriforme]|uniref:Uncharacterized protein n=1 Tax=Glomus cerebriforme TaxID=658196 RepID=A0A397TAG8_9GLOM|nr:hypothetical protein C1645_872920 [Glomus cerebriforme]